MVQFNSCKERKSKGDSYMKVKFTLYLTVDEFREILPIYSPKLQKLFDELSKKLETSGLSEKEAKIIVAKLMLEELKSETLQVIL